MEGAFCIHTLTIHTGQVLAFVMICGVRRKWRRARVAF